MKIAVITDAHNNIHSLRAVLDDIDAEKPDLVFSAGDMVACSAYAGTREVWNLLHDRKIPFVLGNEEERILRFHTPHGEAYLKHSVQFRPLQYRARQFSAVEVAEMRRWPASRTIAGPRGLDVLICHASPSHLSKSPFRQIDAQVEQDLRSSKAQVVVTGHLHEPLQREWNGKQLFVAGSAGLPLRGDLDHVDYLLLTCRGEKWEYQFKTVGYDAQAALHAIRESDFLAQGGPIGWLMLAEALTQQNLLTPFLETGCPAEPPEAFEDWQRLVIAYLQRVGLWGKAEPYIQDFLR